MNGEAPTREGLLEYAAHVGGSLGEGGLRLYFRMPADPARPATPREVRRLEEMAEAEARLAGASRRVAVPRARGPRRRDALGAR